MPRYPFSVSFMAPKISDFTWELLESASGLTFTEPQRKTLVVAMNRYLEGRAAQYATPRMKAVKEYYEHLYRHAKPLVNLLYLHPTNDMHDNQRQIVLQQAAFSEFPLPIDRDCLTYELGHLVVNLKVVLNNLRDKGQQGRPRQEGLRRMIQAWHVIYCEAGATGLGCWWSVGSKQYEGPFLDLLDAALLQAESVSRGTLPDESIHPPRKGLAQMIQKVMRHTHKSQEDKK